VVRKALAAIRGPSGGEEGLRRAAGQGRHFLDFNTEQQADICRNYYLALMSGGDTSA
jgi:hypothetical protein